MSTLFVPWIMWLITKCLHWKHGVLHTSVTELWDWPFCCQETLYKGTENHLIFLKCFPTNSWLRLRTENTKASWIQHKLLLPKEGIVISLTTWNWIEKACWTTLSFTYELQGMWVEADKLCCGAGCIQGLKEKIKEKDNLCILFADKPQSCKPPL